jgi:hypothetical protein
VIKDRYYLLGGRFSRDRYKRQVQVLIFKRQIQVVFIKE